MTELLFREQDLDQELCDSFMANHYIPAESELGVYKAWQTGANMRALAYAAAKAINNNSVPHVSFLNSGSWNTVYLLTFPDGAEVVARIPRKGFRIPRKLQSAVATMTYARYCHGIPCPKILAWQSSGGNPVGTPYTLMERARGKDSSILWNKLPYDSQLELLDNLAKLHTLFARPLPFESIGSIFFSPSAISLNASCSHLGDPSLYEVRPFVCEPVQGIDVWDVEVSTSSLRKFWDSFIEDVRANAVTTWGKARKDVILPESNKVPGLWGSEWTMGQLFDALASLRVLVSRCTIPQDPRLLSPCLVPADYALRNILVDPETLEVTAVLDWDSVSAMPFLLCTRFPEEITISSGAPDQWYVDSGGFEFVPCEEPPVPGIFADYYVLCQQYRRHYESRLQAHDPDKRFTPELWRMREDPLKIQYLVTGGWARWLKRREWLRRRVKALKRRRRKSKRDKQA